MVNLSFSVSAETEELSDAIRVVEKFNNLLQYNGDLGNVSVQTFISPAAQQQVPAPVLSGVEAEVTMETENGTEKVQF